MKNQNKYLFILGVGRSGTTFLGNLLEKTISKIKSVSEPFPGIHSFQKYDYIDPNYIDPFDKERILNAVSHIIEIYQDTINFSDPKIRIERHDMNKEVLLLKEVHALFAFPEIAQQVDAQCIVIVRDTLRVVDSYFNGHTKKQRIYLREEYKFVKSYIAGDNTEKFPLLDKTIKNVSDKMINYFRRPYWMTSELMRQTAITEVLRRFLIEFSNNSKGVMLVTHEELSSNPVEIMIKIFKRFSLQYDQGTLDKIKEMTTSKGKSNYYSTVRNSQQELTKPFRYLTKRKRKKILNLISSSSKLDV